MFKKLREQLVKSTFADGKLTYAGIVAIVSPALSQFFGFEVAPDVLLDAIQGVGAVVTLIGYVRRALKNKETPVQV